MFEGLIQTGLRYVYEITDGKDGIAEYDCDGFAIAGGLSFLLTIAIPTYKFVKDLVKDKSVFKYTFSLLEGFFKKMIQLCGLDGAKMRFKNTNLPHPEAPLNPEMLNSAPSSNGVHWTDKNVPDIKGKTTIYWNGKAVITTPEKESKNAVEAAKWFRESYNNLEQIIDKTQPFEAQLRQIEQCRDLLLKAADKSLLDPDFSSAFRKAFNTQSVKKIAKKVGGSGEARIKAVIAEILKPINEKKWFEPGACFAAGTLVHTKNGLVPIEQIKVGDWVLSKPENGGEQAYKRVLNTFKHEPERVMKILCQSPDDENYFKPIIATPGHPFWVVDKGWTAAGDLINWRSDEYFELHDGKKVLSGGRFDIYITEHDGVGWTSSTVLDLEGSGSLFDYANHKFIANDVKVIKAVKNGKLKDPYFKLPVYNLEVEDFHTYYVGEFGVWVHNTNCGGALIS